MDISSTPSDRQAVALPRAPMRSAARGTVFSNQRDIEASKLALPKDPCANTRLKMEGLLFLSKLLPASIAIAFFDPQYRGMLDKMRYGNEGLGRGRARAALQQMSEETITAFIARIDKVLIPSGHLFLWVDKFHLCNGIRTWLANTCLDIVDMVVWDKGRMGMGYRTRRQSEYCLVLQKQPKRAKGVWTTHNLPDVYQEVVANKTHPHSKPLSLQEELIQAVSHPGDMVIDPAAGSFSVLEAAKNTGRHFLGCDLNG